MLAKIVLAGLAAGLLYLIFFRRPHQPSGQQLLDWIEHRLDAISNELEHDIELEKQGQYPHEGRHDFERKGAITYTLLDEQDVRVDFSEHITLDDIRASEAWTTLASRANELGLELTLQEVNIEGDGVDDDYSLDEYIDEPQRTLTVTVSGW